MNKYWMAVFIATIFEVIWVIGLKYSTNIIEWIGTIICILLTFVLLTFANKLVLLIQSLQVLVLLEQF